MPPKTRRRAAAPSQTTLSFNSKVTKPSQSDHISSAKSNKKRLSDPAKESIVEQISTPDPESGTVINLEQEEDEEVKPEPVTSPIQPRKKNRISGASSTHSDPREAAADKVTDAQIKKYWQKEEESRLAPRGTHCPPRPLLPLPSAIFPQFTNTKSHSPPKRPPPARKDPPPFRPVRPVRQLYRHHTPSEVEARERARTGAAA